MRPHNTASQPGRRSRHDSGTLEKARAAEPQRLLRFTDTWRTQWLVWCGSPFAPEV